MTGSITGRTIRALFLGAVAMGIAGCESIGNPLEAIGVDRSSPDEFAVLARKPLQMPASLALPEPRLGEVSKLEPDPNSDAIVALLGQRAPVDTARVSAGETALLSAANASQEQREIRSILASEAEREDDSGAYEPPTLLELFSSDPSGVSADELIDAATEARRLQTQGVSAAPIDPLDAPVDTTPVITGRDPGLQPRKGT